MGTIEKNNSLEKTDHIVIIEDNVALDENNVFEEDDAEGVNNGDSAINPYHPHSLFETILSSEEDQSSSSPNLDTSQLNIYDIKNEEKNQQYVEITKEENRRIVKENRKVTQKRQSKIANQDSVGKVERDRDIFNEEDQKRYFWKNKNKAVKTKRQFNSPMQEQLYKQNILARPMNIVHTLFTMSELLCIALTEINNNSVCVKTNELKLVPFFFVTINYSIFFSDMFLFALMLINANVGFKSLVSIFCDF